MGMQYRIEMARKENLWWLSGLHQQLLSAVRTASALLYITLSASTLHRHPKVLPPNSNDDLRLLT